MEENRKTAPCGVEEEDSSVEEEESPVWSTVEEEDSPVWSKRGRQPCIN